MRLASTLLGLPLIATIVISLVRGTRHLAWDWPLHAHHHLVANISTAVGLAIVSLVVLAVPFRGGERWAWWVLLVAGVGIFGGFWIGNATVGLGEPAAVPNTAQGILTLIYATGLALGWSVAPDSTDAGPEGGRHRSGGR